MTNEIFKSERNMWMHYAGLLLAGSLTGMISGYEVFGTLLWCAQLYTALVAFIILMREFYIKKKDINLDHALIILLIGTVIWVLVTCILIYSTQSVRNYYIKNAQILIVTSFFNSSVMIVLMFIVTCQMFCPHKETDSALLVNM